MKKLELIFIGFAILGIALKLFNVVGSAILLTLSLSMLSILYYLLGFSLFNGIRLRDIFKKKAYQDCNSLNIIVAILLGISLSIICVGELFKLELWPGGELILSTGLGLMAFVLLINFIFFYRKKPEFFKRTFKRMTFFASTGLLILLTSDNAMIDFFYGDQPEVAELHKK